MTEINLVLRINEQYWDTLYKGDPATITVTISNLTTREDEQHNEYIDSLIEELETKLQQDEIKENEFDQEKERLENQKIPIDIPQIGDEETHWIDKIKLLAQDNDEWVSLDWDFIRLNFTPEENIVTLSSQINVVVQLGLSSNAINDINDNLYKIKAIYEEYDSNIIFVKITKEEEAEPSNEKLERIGKHLLFTGAIDETQNIIDQLFEKDPQSIRGQLLLGEMYEALGENEKALEAYQKARENFFIKDPDFWEVPRIIDNKITRLTETLKTES